MSKKLPSVIVGLSNNDYHHSAPYTDYLSSTQLKQYLVSPKYAKYMREHPEESEISKDAADFGNLYHSAMESLVNYGSLDYWRGNLLNFDNPINPRTGEAYGKTSQKYQQALEDAISANPNKVFADKADIERVEAMVNALLHDCRETSAQVAKIIKWGKAEISHFIEYEGCKFKFRPDCETKTKIIDWKTINSADLSEATINRQIVNYHYGISAAFYQKFLFEQTGEWKQFIWVFQQKNPPYDAVMVSADWWAYQYHDEMVSMGVGAQIFQKLLDQHIYCTKNNDFDGAQGQIQPSFGGKRIMQPEPPIYYASNLEFYNKK